MKDLVALVADRNMESALRGLLSRHMALRIRPLLHTIYVHPYRDPGCLLDAHDFLRPFWREYRHALVMFDREGCGRENYSRENLEEQVQERLSQSGWDDRAAAIVFDPELEIWVWSDSPQVEAVLGWGQTRMQLRQWLRQQRLLGESERKPERPKEAVQSALKRVRRPRSSSLYLQMARTVGFEGCTDRAFLKFRAIMQNWFAEERRA